MVRYLGVNYGIGCEVGNHQGGLCLTEMELIREQMKKDEINESHSGASYAGIMREMQYIAKYGYTQYAREYTDTIN